MAGTTSSRGARRTGAAPNRVKVVDWHARLEEMRGWVGFGAIYVVGLATAGVLPTTGWDGEAWQGLVFVGSLLAVVPLLCGYYLWRTSRLGVVMDTSGISVRNRESATRLAYADVVTFELRPGRYDRIDVVTAVCTDGETLEIDGLRAAHSHRSRVAQRRRERAQGFADRLNRELAVRRTS